MAEVSGSIPSTGSPGGLSRGRRDLIVALLIVIAVAAADRLTGRRLERGLVSFAGTLSVWYEDRRQPAVTCIPSRAVAYDADENATWSVPECWQVEVDSLLNRRIHYFRDPEARAGTLTILVEPIESEEDAASLESEFETLASIPGAIVDGIRNGGKGESHEPSPESWRRTGSGGLAERIAHEPEPRASADGAAASAAPGSPQQRLVARNRPAGGSPAESPDRSSNASTDGRAVGSGESAAGGAEGQDRASSPFHRVEVGGRLGPTAPPGESAARLEQEGDRVFEGRYPRRTWTFLLLGDRCAVRMTYLVRAEWAGSSVVADEFRRVRAVADSVRPRPPAAAR
jgi:hypothetical protein